jgi:hypothetical protein
MKTYVYVERSRLDSVLKHGYLSARAQFELLGKAPPAAKYARQMADATRAYPELHTLLAAIECTKPRGTKRSALRAEKTLAYLDWRDERTLRGSRAVYFLYAPVPDDPVVREFVRRLRGDFLRGRALLELDIGDRLHLTPVGPPHSPKVVAQRPSAWWLKLWRTLASAGDEGRGRGKGKGRGDGNATQQLWFDGVPHAYCTPRSGRVPPSRIRVLGV